MIFYILHNLGQTSRNKWHNTNGKFVWSIMDHKNIINLHKILWSTHIDISNFILLQVLFEDIIWDYVRYFWKGELAGTISKVSLGFNITTLSIPAAIASMLITVIKIHVVKPSHYTYNNVTIIVFVSRWWLYLYVCLLVLLWYRIWKTKQIFFS